MHITFAKENQLWFCFGIGLTLLSEFFCFAGLHLKATGRSEELSNKTDRMTINKNSSDRC